MKKRAYAANVPSQTASDRQFERRVAELEKALRSLELRRIEGWGYRRVHIAEGRVRAHTRKAHWALVQCKVRR